MSSERFYGAQTIRCPHGSVRWLSRRVGDSPATFDRFLQFVLTQVLVVLTRLARVHGLEGWQSSRIAQTAQRPHGKVAISQGVSIGLHEVNQSGDIIVEVWMGFLSNRAVPLNGPVNVPQESPESGAGQQHANPQHPNDDFHHSFLHTSAPAQRFA